MITVFTAEQNRIINAEALGVPHLLISAQTAFDAAIEKAGPMVGDRFRILPLNGGFSLEEQTLMLEGCWKWKQVSFNRKFDALQASIKRRERSLYDPAKYPDWVK